ncbi:MAG: 1-acyl-sn-glycerol-3-phosphate acyltransferase [Chloroflexi bacterium]|nr:1-acyl-sn-glycerol-3-phosphate acyltransferase [Chloroflexota bacterium]
MTPAPALSADRMSALTAYIGRRPLKPRFWLCFAAETLGGRSVGRVIHARAASESLSKVEGLENVPAAGEFILAANHFSGRAAYDTTAMALLAASRSRPDILDRVTMVVGQHQMFVPSRLRRVVISQTRRLVDWVFHRWRAHALRIPLRNSEPSPVGLRAWRERRQPVFVFPEGRAGVTFGKIRRGAGRWLAAQDMPVVPVGVWWEQDGGWSVCFGAPIPWTHRLDLRDVQLGLEMAALLPEALAFDWQLDLARWRAAHHPR